MKAKNAQLLSRESFLKFWRIDPDLDRALGAISKKTNSGEFEFMFRFSSSEKREVLRKELEALKYLTETLDHDKVFCLYVNWQDGDLNLE